MKRSTRWLGSLLVLALAACQQIDRNPSGPENAGTGQALVYLPQLPAEFLAKAAADTGDSGAVFTLSITGAGMQPRHLSFNLRGAVDSPVVINGIPAGPARVFKGQLLQAGKVTHEGSDTVPIEKGKIASVYLRLAAVNSNGGASVCVEVEGLPPPKNCRPRPNPPGDTPLSCWRVQLAPSDTFFYKAGSLRLMRVDSSLLARFAWDDSSNNNAAGFMGQAGGQDALYLFGEIPDGIGQDSARSAGNSIHYKARISVDGNFLDDGAMYRVPPGGIIDAQGFLGTWKGFKTACPGG